MVKWAVNFYPFDENGAIAIESGTDPEWAWKLLIIFLPRTSRHSLRPQMVTSSRYFFLDGLFRMRNTLIWYLRLRDIWKRFILINMKFSAAQR